MGVAVTRNATVRRRYFRCLAAAAAVLTGCCVLLAGSQAAQGASASTARAWGVAERIPHLNAIAAALGSKGDGAGANGGVDFSAVSWSLMLEVGAGPCPGAGPR